MPFTGVTVVCKKRFHFASREWAGSFIQSRSRFVTLSTDMKRQIAGQSPSADSLLRSLEATCGRLL